MGEGYGEGKIGSFGNRFSIAFWLACAVEALALAAASCGDGGREGAESGEHREGGGEGEESNARLAPGAGQSHLIALVGASLADAPSPSPLSSVSPPLRFSAIPLPSPSSAPIGGAMKRSWKFRASMRERTRPKASWDDIPLGSSQKVSNRSILALPKVSISTHLSAPARSARMATAMTSQSLALSDALHTRVIDACEAVDDGYGCGLSLFNCVVSCGVFCRNSNACTAFYLVRLPWIG